MSVYDEARLADAVWWLAHGDGGRALLGPRMLGLALAGGLLGELILVGKIEVWQGSNVVACHRDPPPDPLSTFVYREICREPNLPISIWLNALRRVSVVKITQRLGLTTVSPRHRLLPGRFRTAVTRAPTGQAADLVWASLSVRLHRRESLSVADAVVVGLAEATGLGTHLLEGASASVYLHAEREVTALPQALWSLVTEVRRAVARDALTLNS